MGHQFEHSISLFNDLKNRCSEEKRMLSGLLFFFMSVLGVGIVTRLTEKILLG